MTNTITAANDILAHINADLANTDGRFTMTHSQLRCRIDQYFEYCEDATADAVYTLLSTPGMIHCFRD
jgi:hypothetical protein